jgi:hypothetical protein
MGLGYAFIWGTGEAAAMLTLTPAYNQKID